MAIIMGKNKHKNKKHNKSYEYNMDDLLEDMTDDDFFGTTPGLCYIPNLGSTPGFSDSPIVGDSIASTLHFNGKTKQLVYIALSKEDALKAINSQSVPQNTKAYEYKENITLKTGEVILGVLIDIADMLDITNLSEYKRLNKMADLNTFLKESETSIMKIIVIHNIGINLVGIVEYTILNNKAVRHVFKPNHA